MKQKPQVEILELRLRCPECDYILESDVCNNCGCEINTEEITIDIQVEEILTRQNNRLKVVVFMREQGDGASCVAMPKEKWTPELVAFLIKQKEKQKAKWIDEMIHSSKGRTAKEIIQETSTDK